MYPVRSPEFPLRDLLAKHDVAVCVHLQMQLLGYTGTGAVHDGALLGCHTLYDSLVPINFGHCHSMETPERVAVRLAYL